MSHHLPLVPDRTAPLFRVALVAGGLAGMAGVMLAALASHADTTGMMRPAADMLLVHAPALLALGVMAQVRRVPLLPVAFALIVAGLALFCGDLISRAVQDTRLFAMAAPTGGMLMIVGWAAVALSASIVRGR
ncbi:DUF423 domain-containing protein [Polymorphum gilvum]|uniref:Hypothetical Membrane Spanning Protein n=1 Tax=Polymorphum gilvum (strain LMG 25793 / CGMCC 1.9160 / SL003B-26A1) TaxID=991905 RepID=F2IWQ6_POLGS|nr:DUF423 domain-containing protein [Polymorphum gilvum]ADZ70381.1 Hypothetical Membrane Spanning Protein [Polymorphum gilvum SL003B-26A1]